MKIRYFVILIIAIFVGASCVSDKTYDQPVPIPGETRRAYIQVDLGTAGTRAQEPSAVGSVPSPSSAVIYFLRNTADLTVVEIITAGEDGDISMQQLTEGFVVDNLPPNIIQAYVVANYNSSDSNGEFADFPLTVGSGFADIFETLMDIEQVNYPAIGNETGITSMPSILSGGATVREYSVDPGGWLGGVGPQEGDLYAQISILPVVSRLEIGKIYYQGTATSFVFDGIYVNNFYPVLPLSLSPTGSSILSNGTDRRRYDYNSTTFPYRGYSTMYDYMDSAITVGVTGAATVNAGAGNIFAYQTFGNTPPPQIVLKFRDVVFADGTLMEEAYVTYSNFVDADQDAVNVFERGRIYQIAQLTVQDENFRPGPETTEAVIEVAIKTWTNVNIGNIL